MVRIAVVAIVVLAACGSVAEVGVDAAADARPADVDADPGEPGRFPGPCQVAIDEPVDGTIDQVVVSRYDSAGRRVVFLQDGDADGGFERRFASGWVEATGAPRYVRLDDDGDGRVDGAVRHSYGHGIHREELDYGNDGVPERVVIEELDPGNDVRVRRVDENGDGVFEVVTVWDDLGRTEREDRDPDGNGALDSVLVCGYVDPSRVIYFCNLDSGADGNVDEMQVQVFDSAGNIVSEELDRDADGVIDARGTSSYGPFGVLRSDWDEGADGTIDERYVAAYDADGHVVLEEDDWSDDAGGIDGIPEERHVAQYDSAGHLVVEEYDSGDAGIGVDGIPDERYLYAYDARGNLVAERFDVDADGAIDELARYEYDDHDNETLYEDDTGADGVIEDRRRTAYDTRSNPVMTEREHDGVLVQRASSDYGCYAATSFVSDESWKVTSDPPPSTWTQIDFDDSAWAAAVSQAGWGDAPWGVNPLFPGNSGARWIWNRDSRQNGDTDTLRFRKTFVATSTEVLVTIAADNVYSIYVDGVELGTGDDYRRAQARTVALMPGQAHVIAVQVVNLGGPGGLLVDVR